MLSNTEKMVFILVAIISGYISWRTFGSLVKIIKPIEIVQKIEINDFIKVWVNDYWIYIWSPEAALVYLLAAWKYWNSEYDMYRAKILWKIRMQ